MSSLAFLPILPGLPVDQVVGATVRVQLTNGMPTHYRLAQFAADLGYGSWQAAPGATFDLPVWLPGFQQASPACWALEAKYADDSTEILVTPAITRGAVVMPPPDLPNPPGYVMRATFATGVPYHCQQYNDTMPAPGNNFWPFDWSSELGGYAWSTERTRAIDVGETPDDIIAAHVYARWMPGAPNVWDFSPNTTALKAVLGSKNLDLKGGKLYFAVLCTHPDGKRGRYHLYGSSRAVGVGTGDAFVETSIAFPSGSNADWRCSFGADGVPIGQMPPGPSFAIEAVELIIRDFSAPPTGQLRIKEFAVVQP